MTDLIETPNKVVALSYDGITAPILSAKGTGEIADQIIALAKEHNIPIREEPDLVNILAKLKLDEEIPRELYIAIAEIIAFAYMIKGKVPNQV